MSADREVTGIVRTWLTEGGTVLPDRVLDAVLDKTLTMPQHRRRWMPSGMVVRANAPAFGAAAALVLALVVLGTVLTHQNVGPEPSPTPTSAPTQPVVVVTVEPTVVLPPSTPLPDLSQRFTSTVHGYSISYPAGWTAEPATEPWPPGFGVVDIQSDPAINDHLVATKDQLVVTSQPLPVGMTFEAWLVAYHDALFAQNSQCSFAPSSSWSIVNVGGQPGRLFNSAGCEYLNGVAVPFGGRVYVFIAWTDRVMFGQQTDPERFVPYNLLIALLDTVAFDPASAVDVPAIASSGP